MKALVYVKDHVMELRDVERPSPTDGGYLIRVRANGICGSDVEGFLGKTGRRSPGVIMGHEFAGIIEEAPVGGAFAIGTKVVVFPKPYCGVCEYCKQGMVNVCPAGICMGVLDSPGSMCEYVTVEEKYLLPFEGISFDIASMTEPLAVAYRSVYKITDHDLAKAESILIIGAGTIGLLVLALLKHRGAKSVIVSDASAYRLQVAKEMGADHLINPITDDFNQSISAITGARGVDISIEAVGIEATAKNSIEALRLGGTALWIGNAAKNVEVPMQRIVTKELKIIGNYVYDLNSFCESLRLLEEGKIDVTPLITHRYPLIEGVEAFNALQNNADGRMLKVILES